MTTADAIDLLVNYYDNVDATDASNTNRRARQLFYLQCRADEVWNYRDWVWTGATDNSLSTTSNVCDVPADFGHIPSYGGVYLTDNGQELMGVDPSIIIGLIESNQLSSEPDVYCLYGYNTTTGAMQIMTPGDCNLTIYYKKVVPVLTDSGAPSGFEEFPAQYHTSVLVAGAAALTQVSKSDMRPDWNAIYTNGLMQMCARERQNKPSIKRFPMALGGKW